MKKKTRKLVIAVAALLLLVGALLIVKNLTKEDETTDAGEDVTYDIATVSADDLTSVNITVRETVVTETDSSATDSSAVSSGSSLVIRKLQFAVKDDKSGWEWSEDANVPLSNDAFSEMVSYLDEAESEIRLENVTDEKLADFGLAEPYITVTFGFDGSDSQTYNIGKLNSYNSQYYFSDATAPTTVYMVSSTVVDALNVSVSDMLEWDELPSITSTKIQGLKFETGGHVLSYTYYSNGNDDDYTDGYKWYLSIDGGTEFPVSSSLSTGLTNVCTSMSFEECVQYTGELSADYGLENPSKMTLLYTETETVTDSDETEMTISKDAEFVLNFGSLDSDGYYYCKTDDSQLVYTLTYSDVVMTALSDDTTDIRPTEIISLNMERVDRVKFVASGSVLDIAIEHTAESTTYTDASGADFNSTKFDAIIDGLGEVTAASYTSVLSPVSSSGTDVIFSAEFAFNAGTTSSAVLEIRNYSENYCQVSFMGRDDQLITVSDANDLIGLVCDYFKSET